MNASGPKPDSFRRLSAKNVAISAFVAGTLYFSLTLIAKRFGGSPGSDAYFFLLSLTTLLSGIVTTLFATVFLPLFVQIRVNDGHRAAEDFAGSVLAWCLVAILPVAVSALVWYPQFYRLVSKFSDQQIHDLRYVLVYFSSVFVISVIAEFLRVIALALGRYVEAALVATFQPLTLIVCLYCLGPTFHEESLSIALLMARLLSLGTMLYVVTVREKLALRLMVSRNGSTIRFVRLSAPYWSANVVTNFATFYFDYAASGLGVGFLTALSYAQRVAALPTSVVLTPILEIGRTRFAEFQARGDRTGFQFSYNQLLQLSLFISIPIAVLYAVLPGPIISSMFERGAFTAENVQVASSCLRIYACSLPFVFLFLVNGRATESFQRLLWPSVFGTIGYFVLAGAVFVFVRKWGYLGIPLARVATDIFYFFPFGFLAVWRFAGRLYLKGVGRVFIAASAASLVPVFVYLRCGLAERFTPLFPSLKILVSLLLPFVVIYTALAVALSDRESAFFGFLRRHRWTR